MPLLAAFLPPRELPVTCLLLCTVEVPACLLAFPFMMLSTVCLAVNCPLSQTLFHFIYSAYVYVGVERRICHGAHVEV